MEDLLRKSSGNWISSDTNQASGCIMNQQLFPRGVTALGVGGVLSAMVQGKTDDEALVGNGNHYFPGSFAALLSYANAGALYNGLGVPATDNFQKNIGQLHHVDGYEAGEDSAFETDNTSGGEEVGAEENDTDEYDSDDIDCVADNDGKYVAAVEDDIQLKKFQDRGYSADLDEHNPGTDDTVFLDDEVLVMDDNTFMDNDIEMFNDTSKLDEEELAHAEDDINDIDEATDKDEETIHTSREEGNLPSEETSACLLGDCGCTKHKLAQEISENYLQTMKAGYKKRNRTRDGPDCRKPRDMGAIEIALRLAGKRKTEHIFEPVLGMVFDSKEEAYEFYNMYSWECGFGIIYSKCVRRQSDKDYRSKQELRCEREGKDPRVSGSTKKINCKAMIKLLRDEDGGWYVSEFIKEHNHPFAEGCCEKREWFSHKRLDPYSLGVIKYLREANVNPTAVRCIVGAMFGSLKGAPCTKRTIRAICNQIAREQMDDDVAKTLEVFRQMKANDPNFQWSVETVKDSRINTLMWCSGKSREQYACFGDVVTFDTTYCTNFYKMPFGLFVGVNNHFQIVVFGGVLMRTETTESFEWVFKEFVKLMGGSPPKTVLTDQCKAMTIAVGRVWPDTFHLWCKWHVLKKIRESLGPTYTKNQAFRDEFYSIINEMLTKKEFEDAWHDLCSRYKLTDNPFMIRTFQCRSKWAKPWSKGNFCAGMTSTQRSESANWMLKRFVPRNSSMNKFVSQFNLLLDDRDMEEGREENMTKQLFVKYNRLWPIERHAVKIYTRQSLKLFRKQVDMAANFKVSGRGRDFFVIERNRECRYPHWRKNSFRVYVYDNGARYLCECGYFEHVGILCCHTIRLMIRYEIKQIPEMHILTRWTRNAKDILPHHMRFSTSKDDQTGSMTIWHRRLNTKALEACTKGNTYRETYDIVMKHLNKAIKEADEYIEERRKIEEAKQTDTNEVEIPTDVESTKGNRYGASGSSAGLSDSEILKLRGPIMERGRGRPVGKRLISSAEKGSRRTTKRKKPTSAGLNKGSNTSTKKQKNKENLAAEDGSVWRTHHGLPYQTTFCSKCRKLGHRKDRCPDLLDGQRNNTVKYRCEKCGLNGHKESECLLMDDDSGGFFR